VLFPPQIPIHDRLADVFREVRRGISLKAVQELLGHADIKMTMRYSHLSQSHLQDAMAVLNKIGNGHQMDTKTPKRKEADNLSIATPL
jgi:hypothetical protein